MTYAGQIARILVSAPGDLGDADRGTILETVNAWNVREGATHGVAFVPMHWSADAAAEYGIRPQESINQQLVDRADVVIAGQTSAPPRSGRRQTVNSWCSPTGATCPPSTSRGRSRL
jgi:hypothetical protein